MRSIITVFYIGMALAAGGEAAGAQRVVLTHVNIVDVATGKISRDRSITMDGEVISEVGAATSSANPRVQDFTGAYVIPGLWDMHAHLSGISRPSLAALLASGVTGLRDVDADTLMNVALRDSIEDGLVPGPHLIFAGSFKRQHGDAVVHEASMVSDAEPTPPAPPKTASKLDGLMRLVRQGFSFTPTPLLLRADNSIRANLRLMAETGVILLAGSDAGSPLVPLGYSVVDQLIELVNDAGLTPLQSLQSATTSVARTLGLSVTYGTVEPGRAADFVILDKNPLDNILNLKEIRAVVRGGKIYDRIALDSLVLSQRR